VSADQASRGSRILTWFVLALSVVLTALGVYWYGWSSEVQERFWTDIAERAHGPMTFRFYLQPTMAAIAAYHDGVNDVRRGHKAFFWTGAGTAANRRVGSVKGSDPPRASCCSASAWT
jgi:hypothetical protein